MNHSGSDEEIPPGYKKCRYCCSSFPQIGLLKKHYDEYHPRLLAELLAKQLPLDQPTGARKKPVKQRPLGREGKKPKIKKDKASYLEWRDKASLEGYRVFGTASEAIRYAKGKSKGR